MSLPLILGNITALMKTTLSYKSSKRSHGFQNSLQPLLFWGASSVVDSKIHLGVACYNP